MHSEYVEVTISIQLNLHSQMLEYESFEAIQLLDPNSTFFCKTHTYTQKHFASYDL